MLRPLGRFGMFAVLVAGSPSWSASQIHAARGRQHRLTFTTLPTAPSQGALDSLISITPKAGGASVQLAYDNPCQVNPRGKYEVRGDTLSLVLWDWPPVPQGGMCPGIYLPTAFTAPIAGLRAGRYVVRVAFRHVTGFLAKQPNIHEIEIP
jgi:hypothetical protein